MLKKRLRKFCRHFGVDFSPYQSNTWRDKVVSLQPKAAFAGDALVSFITRPFMDSDDQAPVTAADITMGCVQIVELLRERGYAVDVIYYQNREFEPKKHYGIFVDLINNMERIGPLLNGRCIKILHPRWAHWFYNNCAVYKRCLDFENRRGLFADELRLEKPNRAAEMCDCIIVLGNDFVADTYRYAGKPVYQVPYGISASYPPPLAKDYEASRNRYLFLSGGGMVHKGLDLLLEAFASMPEYHLYICARLNEKSEFVRCYSKEIYHLPNIHYRGYVDIDSPEFRDLADQCIAHLHPSCCEHIAGSVLRCMNYSLIPVASRESSIDIGDSCGIVLEDCSVKTITRTVKELSALPVERLRAMSKNSRDFTVTNHSRERFERELRNTFDRIISTHGSS